MKRFSGAGGPARPAVRTGWKPVLPEKLFKTVPHDPVIQPQVPHGAKMRETVLTAVLETHTKLPS